MSPTDERDLERALYSRGLVYFDRIKQLAKRGIPPKQRALFYLKYSHGQDLYRQYPDCYQKAVDCIESPDDRLDALRNEIERDLYRTFPDHIKFKSKRQSVNDSNMTVNETDYSEDTQHLISLRRVLISFGLYSTGRCEKKNSYDIGYCQSLNFIAATLLLVFTEQDPESTMAFESKDPIQTLLVETHVFWTLVGLIEFVLPPEMAL